MKKKFCFNRDCKFSGLFKLLKVMKLTVFLLLFSVVGVLANKSYSQTKELNLNMREATVKEVLNTIEKQSEFYFLYSENLIDVERKVDVTFKNKKIEHALKLIFEGTDVTYSIRDRIIVLTTPEVSGNDIIVQQQKTVSGAVTDKTGEPLPGVTVVVKGTTRGTVTNADGNYSLTNIPEDATLVFSFVGLKTQEIAVYNQTQINVEMEVDAIGLDEVIAIGYGTMKKSDLTGSVAMVTSETINRIPSSNIEDALKGRMAGVLVQQSAGANPTGGSFIRIRGYNSINPDANTPLYVINGMPMQNVNLSAIDPENIQSVNVLKDASATAIYGSRAAGGVILITTKKGIEGESSFNFSVQTGVQNPIDNYDMANSEEWYRGMEIGMDLDFTEAEKMANKKYLAYFTPLVYDAAAGKPKYDVAWDEAFLNYNAPWNKYSLNVTGGKEGFNYYINGSYEDRDGVLIGSEMKRYSLNSNFEIELTKKLRVGTTFNGSVIQSKRRVDLNERWGRLQTFEQTIFTPAWVPNEDENGNPIDLPSLRFAPGGFGLTDEELKKIDTQAYTRAINWNKLYQSSGRDYTTSERKILTTLYLEFEPVKKLIFKVNGGVDFSFNDIKNIDHILPLLYQPDASVNIRRDFRYNQNYLVELTGKYSWQPLPEHNFEFLAGTSIQKDRSDFIFQNAWGSVSNELDQLSNMPLSRTLFNGNEEITVSSPAGIPTELRLNSQFGRFNYNWGNRYLLTATLRSDGSSKFTGENLYGVFPSVALGWNIGNENFTEPLDWLSQAKFRASWGLTGSQAGIRNFMYLSKTTTSSNVFGLATLPDNIGNRDIKWEAIEQYNVGLDLGLFDNRINASFDAYYKKTNDMLGDIPLNPASGFSSIAGNLGSMENKGFEFVINSRNVVQGDFSWSSNFVFSLNRNKILDLGTNPDGSKKDDIKIGSRNILKIGYPIHEFYLYKTDGIWQEEESEEAAKFPKNNGNVPGTWKYVDINGDYQLTEDDKMILPSPHPKFSGGFDNIFSYKIFTLSVLATYMYGHKIYNTNRELIETGHPGYSRSKWYTENAWTPENRSNVANRIFNVTNGDPVTGSISGASSKNLEDASFIKIASISLNCSLPENWAAKVALQGATIGFNITNPFVFTKYTGVDPETQRPIENQDQHTGIARESSPNSPRGIDQSNYPNARYYLINLKLRF
jgi:TonB-dependent starch-binding outer membrane protein SusC